MNAAKKRFLIWLIADILWLCLIFGQSLMPGEISSKESGAVFAVLVRIFPFLTHQLVRKMGHFCEFAVLGFLLAMTRRAALRLRTADKRPRLLRETVLPLLAGLAAALCDETIQLGTAGRSGELRDVLIDLAGAAAGIFLLYFACPPPDEGEGGP